MSRNVRPMIAMARALVGPRYRALASSLGVESIRWAIMTTSVAVALGGGLYLLAARTVREDLD